MEPVTDSSRRIPHGPPIDQDLAVLLEKLSRVAWADSSCCLRGIPVFLYLSAFRSQTRGSLGISEKGGGRLDLSGKDRLIFRKSLFFQNPSSMEEILTLSGTTLMIQIF